MLKKDRRTQYSLAVGLSYESNVQDAPELSVKGQDFLADDIVKIAQRYGVPFFEDSDLADLLGTQEVGGEIPEDLYEAVAVILRKLEDGNKQ